MSNILFQSLLAPEITAFIQEKQACGYRYETEEAHLRRFDHWLCDYPCPDKGLSREQVERYLAKRPHERARTHKGRMHLIRQFTIFLRRRGVSAYVPDSRLAEIDRSPGFVPYIFTHQQVRQLLQAVDRVQPHPLSPERHLVLPELFRLLYGCGLRLGEAVRLLVSDVDMEQGVLTIRQGKFRKDRLVPMATSLAERLRRYSKGMRLANTESVLFPTLQRRPYNMRTIYSYFRRALWACGIPHGGRGQGPRLHDLRHTFAVHCLEGWYRRGENLNARLPLLVTYLGHESLAGTQRYLRLTPTVFPDIVARLEAFLQPIVGREGRE
jgi:integrase